MKEKYIIVTGGQFANKGAQAMTYITADEIAKRWPNCKMLMYYNPSKLTDKDIYRFGFINDQGHFLFHSRSFKEILRNTEAIIDISGYAIGSDWSERGNIYYIKTRLIDAKKYDIPVYLMPQSFGPFKFHGKLGKVVIMLLRRYLPFAKIIMAREASGEQELKSIFVLQNVIQTPDLVLQNSSIDLSNVFCAKHEVRDINLKGKNKVAIIPNTNNFRYIDKESMLKLYQKIIDLLHNLGYKVFLIYHSSEDAEICQQIYKANIEGDVELVNEELDCLEFDKNVDQFKFVIASRYHSVVHAYRRRVPAIVLGWAVKYKELLKGAQQDKYLFDLRNKLDEDDLMDSINDMNSKLDYNKKMISLMMDQIQTSNVFDLIKLKSEL